MIQACEQAAAPHSLAQGFGSREAWEVATSDGNVLNAHYRFKELGARVHQVTALRTEDLANWEGEVNLRVSDTLAKLESHTSAAAISERRSTDLIKAAQRAASDNQRELENLRIRFETANRMALHWQEQASLSAESLTEVEAKLINAENELYRHRSDTLSPSRPCSATQESEIVAELRAQISALQMEHAGQIRELESRHAAMLNQLRVAAASETHTAAAVEAVRMEAAAALEEMEIAHAAEIEILLEERARLDSALRCIKDMMHPWGGNNNTSDGANAASGGDGDGVQQCEGFDAAEDAGAASDQESLDGCAADVYLDAPAVGIPVETTRTPVGAHGAEVDPLVASYSAFSARYMRPASAASSGARSLHHYLNGNGSTLGVTAPPATISPAPADFAVFDRAGNRAKVNTMYEMVNALRPGSGDSSTIGGVVATEEQINHDTYHFATTVDQQEQLNRNGSSDNEFFASPRENMSGSIPTSPESRNRVVMAGGGCSMVDYKGERPDAVTEASMRRILDAPTAASDGGGAGASGRASTSLPVASTGVEDEVSYIVRRPSENSTNAQITVKQEEEQATTAKAPYHVPCASAPASTAKSDRIDDIIDGASAWAAGSLSLPASNTSTPQKNYQRDNGTDNANCAAKDENNNENFWAPTADVLALDNSSPSTANFLTQYMADQVSVRASLPSRYQTAGGYAGYGRSGSSSAAAATATAMQPRPKSGGAGGHQPVSNKAKAGKIPAIRHSAPGVLKRSTFLQRPLVSDDLIYG
jgi:hypothetical protein